MSIEKRRDGYCVRWRDTEGRARSRQVRLWRDAVALDGEMKRKKAMGELVTHERGAIRLDDFWEVWWQRYAQTHLTLRTQDNYERLWRRHIQPALGRSRTKNISHEDVDHLVGQLSRKLAPTSVRKVLAVLQCVLQRAVDWGYVNRNAAQGVKRPKLVKQRESIALTQEMVSALRKEFDLRGSTIVAVLAGSGIRPGELRALTWDHVGNGVIRVERAVSSNALGPTKTNSKRAVEITEDASKALLELLFASGRATGFVFPAMYGGVWTDAGWRMWQRKVFRPAAERAGLAGLVPYDLRHTWISQRIAEGWSITKVAHQAGHSVAVAASTYAHLLDESVYSGCTANANTA